MPGVNFLYDPGNIRKPKGFLVFSGGYRKATPGCNGLNHCLGILQKNSFSEKISNFPKMYMLKTEAAIGCVLLKKLFLKISTT